VAPQARAAARLIARDEAGGRTEVLSTSDGGQRRLARHRSGDLTPARYRTENGIGLAESILLVPLVVEGEFQGVAELEWTERPDLVLES
jgi:hypothetical protein